MGDHRITIRHHPPSSAINEYPESQFRRSLVLYHGDYDFSGHSPEDMQAVVAKYGQWAQDLGQSGKLLGGEKLADDAGKVLRPNGGDVSVTDGPFSETKEMIGGYFVIDAENFDEAVEISKSCPHIDYNGPIELREIDKH